MKYLVTGKEMKLLDQNTSTTFKVPQLVLMEQAAMCFVRELFSIVPHLKRVLFFVEKEITERMDWLSPDFYIKGEST